jgi:hypothetical protein
MVDSGIPPLSKYNSGLVCDKMKLGLLSFLLNSALCTKKFKAYNRIFDDRAINNENQRDLTHMLNFFFRLLTS